MSFLKWGQIWGEDNTNKLLNYGYAHDERDPVQYITAPNNLSEFGKGWYLIGQDISNLLIGNSKDLNFDHHDATNPVYLPYYTDKPALNPSLVTQNNNNK